MFITFEGIDGSGKSTQVDMLKSYFSDKGVTCHVFREPGGTAISEQIRSLLLHGADDMDPVTELLLFSSARSQLIAEKVIPLLEKDQTVILDRFYDSTVAYQGFGRESAPLKEIAQLNRIASHHKVPDITFYLKISPEEANLRTQSSSKDRMEKSGAEFFLKVAKGFDELCQKETRFKEIDSTRDKNLVHQDIIDHLEQMN